jgi:hypothetical protein
MRKVLQGSLATLSLAGACAGLALVIWGELNGAPGPRPDASSAAGAETPSAQQADAREAVIASRPLAEYDEIVRRPLFNETRAPMGGSANDDTGIASVRAAPGDEELVLTGIVISADKLIALIWDTRAGKVRRVEQGQSVGRWQLEAVNKDSVTLRHDETQRELLLHEKDKPVPAPRTRGRRRAGSTAASRAAQPAPSSEPSK